MANPAPFPPLEEIIESFSWLDDWEERYRYLIELGRKLPPLPESLRSEDYLVRGCTSRVWLICEEVEEEISFRGDSDAHIVKGLVALLLSATAGRSPDELCALDLTALFKELGLESHLSVSRRNGFFSMVEKMKSYAKARSTL